MRGGGEQSKLAPYAPVMTCADEHIKALHGRLMQLAASLRTAVAECERWKDPL